MFDNIVNLICLPTGSALVKQGDKAGSYFVHNYLIMNSGVKLLGICGCNTPSDAK